MVEHKPAIIGDSTLYLADCNEILPILPDNSASVVITDPPWNVGKDYGVYKDKLSYDDYSALIARMKNEWTRLSGGRVAIVLGSEILRQWWGIYPEAKIIIVKLGAIVLTQKNHMHLQWKAVLTTCVSNDFSTDLWEDIRWPGEGYFFNEPRYGHPAMTPLKLTKRLVSLFTQEGDTVIDPYLGSGTTGVACAQLGRKFIGMEINREYFNTAVKRITEANTQLRLPIKIS